MVHQIKSAIILGGAQGVWDDLKAARALGTYNAVIAINDTLTSYIGPIDYAVSLHPQKYAGWMKEREIKGYPKPKTFVTYSEFTSAGHYPIDLKLDYKWPGMAQSGSSGLFAVKVAIDQGFDKIVLCGVPMTSTPHFFDVKDWENVKQFWPAWEKMIDHFRDQTRSMSGRTMELLGAPTEEWLTENPDGNQNNRHG